MARKETNRNDGQGALGRAAARVRQLFSRRPQQSGGADIEQPIASLSETPTAASVRAPRRETDVALDRIAAEYLPAQTSLKSPFRNDGADQERDQSYSTTDAAERWNDEDQFTNKSGDPRIGTHGRSYEPGEMKVTADRK